jgi:hypothetical protein
LYIQPDTSIESISNALKYDQTSTLAGTLT